MKRALCGSLERIEDGFTWEERSTYKLRNSEIRKGKIMWVKYRRIKIEYIRWYWDEEWEESVNRGK